MLFDHHTSQVTFVYAVLGVQLFYNIAPGDELNEQRNFRAQAGLDPSTSLVIDGRYLLPCFYASIADPEDSESRLVPAGDFGAASLLLIQCLTGDGWSTLMMDSMAGPERGCAA